MQNKAKSTLRFFYNGIKAADGKLQPCTYSDTKLTSYPEGTITIYAKRYKRFSAEVGAAFTIENATDSQTDYFENDSIRVKPDHPLFLLVKAALNKQTVHRTKFWG